MSASVPSNVDQLKKYSITDKMSNALTWVDDKAELKLTYKSNNAEVPGFTLTEGETNDYKLTSPTNDQKVVHGQSNLQRQERRNLRIIILVQLK